MEAKSYIVEIGEVHGEETTIYLAADGASVDYLFAVVSIAELGACVVDNGYRSIEEAQAAWPEAVPPKPYHLTPKAVDRNFTIRGQTPNAKLT